MIRFRDLTSSVFLDVCVRCGVCRGVCHVYLETKDLGKSPVYRLRLMQNVVKGRGIADSFEFLNVYECTLCGRCMEACPFGISTVDLWECLRGYVYSLGKNPENLSAITSSLQEFRNPYSMMAESRFDWVDYLGLENPPISRKADIIYFVGCTPAFKGVCQETAYAASLLLNRLELNWSFLGSDEWCCGAPWIMAGSEEKAVEHAEHNVKLIEDLNAKEVVTTCPSCYRMFKWRYPSLLGRRLNFKVVHITELLANHISSLKPANLFNDVVTYHDPCELGRLGGIIKKPRLILKKTSKNFRELPSHSLNSECCGGGGLLQAVDNDVRVKVSIKRVKQALNIGAKVLVTSCPSCKMTLKDGVSALESDLEVLDLTEFLARVLSL